MRKSPCVRRPPAGRLAGAAVLGALAACAAPPESVEARAPLSPATYVFACPGGYRFSARIEPDSVRLRSDGWRATLPQVVAASGARYASAEATFWSQGSTATLRTPTVSHQECVGELAETPWAEARLLGNDYRAVGQEPGWLVEIDADRRLLVLANYGEVEFQTAAPAIDRRPDGVVVYTARSPQHAVVVTTAQRPCQDAMSGEVFPETVTLHVDGSDYQGCGRPLDGSGEALVNAVVWTLAEIEGAAPSTAGRAPELQLDDRALAVSGFTGCNRFSGGYRQSGDRLSFPEPLATTRMACADPAGTRLEEAFLRVLAATERFSTADGGLTLIGAQGSLARFTRP